MKVLATTQARSNLSVACQLISLCVIILQVLTSEHRTEAKQLGDDLNSIEQQKNTSDQVDSTANNNNNNGNQDAFQVPFIVLMSKDSISVAQLPLIENGTVSVVYSLADSPEAPPTENSGDEEETLADDGADAEENDNNDDDHRNHILNGHRKDDEDHGKSSSSSGTFNADAREYEQMPAETNSSTTMKSLGKSEWQQIAIGTRGSEEEIGSSSSSSQRPQQTTQATSSTTSRKEGEDDVQGEEKAIRPRKRRRRRSGSSGSNSLELTDDVSVAQTNPGYNNEAAKSQQQRYNDDNQDAQAERTQANEASSSSAVALEEATAAESSRNVTSARVRTNSSQKTISEELPAWRLSKKEATTALTTPTEGSDKNSQTQIETRESASSPSFSSARKAFVDPSTSNNVQFCDFDVHMSLGYAFVADSTGRIHRFRLSSGSKFVSSEQQIKYQGPGRGDSMIMSDDLAGNDFANTIDAAGGKFEFSPKLRSTTTNGGGEMNSANGNIKFDDEAADDHHHGDGTLLVGASSEANRVNRQGAEDVLHEQSADDERRQHPTIHGRARNGTTNSTTGPATAATETSDAPISGESQQKNNIIHSHLNAEQLLSPKVIWWRNKYTSHHAQGSEKRTGALVSAAHRSGSTHQVVTGVKSNSATPRWGGVPREHGPAKNSTTTSDHDGHPMPVVQNRVNHLKRASHLPTEVAVDWLNNLLFVLDKYRLFVVDFDGNNELVLIDDFNSNNRPVNLKLDPVNGFLFWLQVGKFHNTIYRLDLNVLSMQSSTQKLVSNTLKLRQVNRAATNGTENVGANFDSSDLVALSSHHYAHAKITNLPRHIKQFTIDHKHSRIYVPLSPAPAVDGAGKTTIATNSTHDFEQTNESQRDDTEIFASSENVTHLNSTVAQFSELPDTYGSIDQNCTNARELNEGENGQILAYNLDGTDVGPLRTVGGKSHIVSLDDMQDLTVDSQKGLLYWLKDDGKELFEEYREGSMSINAAQHNLDGSSYSKLLHFNDNGFNQPTHQKPRFNMRKIVHILANSISTNRLTRGSYERFEEASSLNGRHRLVDPDGSDGSSRFARNAPFIILGITCLLVIAVYLVYAFVFQTQTDIDSGNQNHCHIESIGPGSTYSDDLHVGAEVNSNGFMNSSTISRWVGTRPSTRGGGDVSTLNRGGSTCNRTNQSETCDFESTNYDASNAIDEHYRGEGAANQSNHLFGLDTTTQLANLSHWPSNMHDMSNKLYVPVEVQQDEALRSIHRISIDQLDIEEEKSLLGQGHFGMVLQGTISCKMTEKGQMLHSNGQSTFVPTTPVSLMPPTSMNHQQRSRFPINSTASSSGHGSSSSTSCEFATANSCLDGTTTATTDQGDYLTPRSQGTSSDYNGEIQTLSEAGSYSSYGGQAACVDKTTLVTGSETMVDTKLKVAIKKLKENANVEEKRDFLQEAKLLAYFDHPNIVHLIGICLDRGSTYIVMELMLGGDLIRYMQEHVPINSAATCDQHSESLDYDDLLKICLDIVNGCCYLEDLDYIHRDLAARNCLVSSRKREERIVKLADFGLARDIYKDSYYKKMNDSAMPLMWMAPECLTEQKFTKKSDVWSFGVVLWEVMSYCQEKPYGRMEPFLVKSYLDSGARLRKPNNCDENMYKLMNQCWQMDPENRPTFHECRAILIEIRNNSR